MVLHVVIPEVSHYGSLGYHFTQKYGFTGFVTYLIWCSMTFPAVHAFDPLPVLWRYFTTVILAVIPGMLVGWAGAFMFGFRPAIYVDLGTAHRPHIAFLLFVVGWLGGTASVYLLGITEAAMEILLPFSTRLPLGLVMITVGIAAFVVAIWLSRERMRKRSGWVRVIMFVSYFLAFSLIFAGINLMWVGEYFAGVGVPQETRIGVGWVALVFSCLCLAASVYYYTLMGDYGMQQLRYLIKFVFLLATPAVYDYLYLVPLRPAHWILTLLVQLLLYLACYFIAGLLDNPSQAPYRYDEEDLAHPTPLGFLKQSPWFGRFLYFAWPLFCDWLVYIPGGIIDTIFVGSSCVGTGCIPPETVDIMGIWLYSLCGGVFLICFIWLLIYRSGFVNVYSSDTFDVKPSDLKDPQYIPIANQTLMDFGKTPVAVNKKAEFQE